MSPLGRTKPRWRRPVSESFRSGRLGFHL